MTAVATRRVLDVGVKGFALPHDIVTQTVGILAMKRSGKSNAAVVIAEELFAADLHWVAIDPKGDWWGMRADGPGSKGLPVLVMGGLHGDVPLEASAGRMVADLIVEQHLTAILDVSEFSKADQRRFLTDFAERLYKTNREPLLLICEEADEYIPQRVSQDVTKLVGAFENIVKRGGFRGLGCVLVTQRSASLNKDVLTQCETLVALRTTSALDRKAIRDWVDHYSVGAQALDEIPRLQNGEAWLFSPVWLNRQERIKFRRRRTFDSGATPEVGKSRPPAHLADVDIAQLQERMAATIERAKADDPKELRRKIVDLERSLAAAADKKVVSTEPKIVEKIVEVPVLDEQLRALLQQTRDRLPEMVSAIGRVLVRLQPDGAQAKPTNGAVVTVPPPPAPTRRPRPTLAERSDVLARAIDHDITTSQQRLLDALLRWDSLRVSQPSKGQVAVLLGVPVTSGGFKNNLGALRVKGLIRYPMPNHVQLTDTGRAQANPVEVPASTAEIHNLVMGLVGSSKWRLLKLLIDIYPRSIAKDELAVRAEVPASSGGFKNNLDSLRSLGFLDYPQPGYVAAEPVLFVEEAMVAAR
jgi:hypothetical protein